MARGAFHKMPLDHGHSLRLFPSWWSRAGLVVLVFLYWYLPTHYFDDTTLRTFSTVGAFAIGAIGLNLVSGYCGQISLGHAFFVGVGTYTVGYLGSEQGYPLHLYLPVAALLGFAIGAAIGPFALRLRGTYLVIVTLGLLFVGSHIFENWDSVTGGTRGLKRIRQNAEVTLGPIDFKELSFGGHDYNAEAGMFFLIWATLALAALVAKNITRSRPGRAMQAVRDRDLSAEVIGVNLTRTKVAAFAWAGAYAAVAGVFTGILAGRAGADDFNLLLSIDFVAIIIIGGVGTIVGAVLGALFVKGGEVLIREHSNSWLLDWIVRERPTDPEWFSDGQLRGVLFGLLIVVFLLFEPRGLAALWLRAKTWVLSWPFKY